MAEHGFLIDMDGVIYRGGHLLPGAQQFIEWLKVDHIPFTFLTNNSSRTRRDVCRKLARLGIAVDEPQVFTCAMATARFLAWQKPGGTAYVIGEGGLTTALHQNGYAVVDQDPDYVVVGEGRSFTFEALEKALNMIRGGARLIATNPDPDCPTEHGSRPGCGAIVAMLEQASGRQAFCIGKPNPIMMRAARKSLVLTADQTIMIGDTMPTDILGGVQMGYRTILTLSGGTGRDDLAQYAYTPDMVVESLADLDPTHLPDALADPERQAAAAL